MTTMMATHPIRLRKTMLVGHRHRRSRGRRFQSTLLVVWLMITMMIMPLTRTRTSSLVVSADDTAEESTPNDDSNDGTSSRRRPNILFMMTDQQRFDAIGYVQKELQWYDDYVHVKTPNLDRLLSEGVYFRNAYCQCAVCAPARATLRTGCTVERHGVQHNDLAEEYSNTDPFFEERVAALVGLDQILVQQHGYVSEYYGKWHIPSSLLEPNPNLPSSSSSFGDSNDTVVTYNDFDYVEGDFFFQDDGSDRKVRRYLEEFESTGAISREVSLNNENSSFPQIDTYTRFPYRPVQLDTRYESDPNTPLKTDNGFESYEVTQPNVIGVYSLPVEYTPSHFTGDIAIKALRRLEETRAETDQPWFLTVSFHHPHPPFVAPMEPHLSYYWDNRERLFVPPSIADDMDNSAYSNMLSKIPGYGDPDQIKEWSAIYYALVSECDEYVGAILNELGDGVNNTLIVFTSDHGEMLGAHGDRSKDNFYEESTHVPLFMKYSNQIKAGIQVDEMVSHLDVFATILDYAGASELDTSDGRSLRPFIEGTEYNQDYDEDVVFGEWDFRIPTSENSGTLDREIDERPSFLVRKGKYKLMMQKIRNTDEVDMMFDLESDPFEMYNLLGKNGMDADDTIISKAEHMRCLLLSWMIRHDGDVGYYSDPAANFGDGEGDIIEVRERQKWKTLGVWVGDSILRFGRLTKSEGNGGQYLRHEHLYLGTRQNETARVNSIQVTGTDSEFFSVDRESISKFEQNDCRTVRVTFSPPQNLWSSHTSTVLDATLVIDFDLPSNASFNIQLALSNNTFAGVEPETDNETTDGDDEEDLEIEEPETDGNATIDIGDDGEVPGQDANTTSSPGGGDSVFDDDNQTNTIIDGDDAEGDDSADPVPVSSVEGSSSRATGPPLLLRDVVLVTGCCLLLTTIFFSNSFL